ncbi:cell division protein FtsN [Moellerella wisconsensis]|uniref:Cell division protein FtsN n=2 Tax=Moellerella wisconsensis TaxID=158849 RepID=A0A9Q8V3A3_9GAMM|nr:cell division protein FtsN [Moellerella wisconsensis]KLN97026.1 cell division protein FtsN [Moellerella wisconsensis]UNH24123.1 cell division protein FtsN [Moellerella wisconsensis]UNH27205.1 cell division protein FtsN [Moellerella wisconsensis]UNH30680.1 cell division protein FtsN [Moellerella wisconsensis]UNH38839.1 cell division protein FtsN [Moellerella wisconsensis]
MAQRDYVARGRTAARRKKGPGKKKQPQGLSKTTLTVAVVIVIVFIGGLFFITQNKKDVPQTVEAIKSVKPANTLPPKPEERWRYIKELENRGVDIPNIPELNSGGTNIVRPSDLTAEQRKLLEQIDSDRRRPVTTLSEIPYNGQPVPRSQVIINEPAPVPTAPVKKPEVRIEPKVEKRTIQQPQQSATQQQAAAPAPSVAVKPEKKPVENIQKMLVQCGSFRTTEQAESVRATLAFSGIESRISSGGGWHRIVLGPYSKETADKMRSRASDVGVSGCILRASGG